MEYVVGGDPAEGLKDGDYSPLFVAKTMPRFIQVASFHTHIAPDLFGMEAAKVARMYNDALVVMENNLIASMRAVEEECNNIYYQIQEDNIEHNVTNKAGWKTTTRSKQKAIDDFRAGLRDGIIEIKDEQCIDEFLNFIYDDKGRPNAQYGCHDDRVISALLAYQGYLESARVEPKQEMEITPFNKLQYAEAFRGGDLWETS